MKLQYVLCDNVVKAFFIHWSQTMHYETPCYTVIFRMRITLLYRKYTNTLIPVTNHYQVKHDYALY